MSLCVMAPTAESYTFQSSVEVMLLLLLLMSAITYYFGSDCGTVLHLKGITSDPTVLW